MPSNWADPRDLASLREKKGLSLQGIAEATNIAVRYLEAIEQGNFAKLPGGFYNVSYIRQYADSLGCDSAILLEQYYTATGYAPQQVPDDNPATRSQFSLVDWIGPRALLNLSVRRLRKI